MRKSVVLGLAVALLGSVVGCASIALEEVSGETEAVTVRAKDGAIAVGPFRYLSTDWLPIGRPGSGIPRGRGCAVVTRRAVQTCLILTRALGGTNRFLMVRVVPESVIPVSQPGCIFSLARHGNWDRQRDYCQDPREIACCCSGPVGLSL